MAEQTNIATLLASIQESRNKIRNKFVELGLATSVDKLSALANATENIQNQGAVSANVKEGETYTIPKGYHNGSGTVSGVSGGGNYALQEKSITPTKQQQNVVSDDGFYGLSSVTVNPIPAAYQDVSSVTAGTGDVLTGKVFVDNKGGVQTGTMPNNGAVTKTLDTTTKSYTIPKGYHSGTGAVSITTEEKSATPTKSTQTITPTSGKVLSKVTVNPIPSDYITTTDANAAAAQILDGYTAYVKGSKVTGTMANNADVTASIDGLTNMNVVIPQGFTTGGTISLTSDIEEALALI